MAQGWQKMRNPGPRETVRGEMNLDKVGRRGSIPRYTRDNSWIGRRLGGHALVCWISVRIWGARPKPLMRMPSAGCNLAVNSISRRPTVEREDGYRNLDFPVPVFCVACKHNYCLVSRGTYLIEASEVSVTCSAQLLSFK